MPVTNKIFLEEVKNKIDKGIISGVLKGAEMIVTNIQKETPVLTGTLKSGTVPEGKVDVSKNEIKTKVVNNVKYAAPVEFGRHDQPNRRPVGMFRKGGDASRESVLQILNNSLPKS